MNLLKNIFEKAVLIYVFLIPFTVAPIIMGSKVLWIIDIVVALFGLIILLSPHGKIYLGRVFINCFYIPIILSLIIGLPVAIVVSPLGINYWELPELMSGRLLNYLILFIILKTIMLLYQEKDNYRKKIFLAKYIKAYWIGCLILLLIGFWQVVSWKTGLLFPFEGMRTRVHSVDASLQYTVIGRMTSLAAEPSYVVPFIIDFILISILLLRKIKIFIAATVGVIGVYYTFSGGGYMDIAIIFLATLLVFFFKQFFIRSNRPKVVLVVATIFIVMIITFVVPYIENNLMIVLSRKDTLFDVNQHSRAVFIFEPFKLMQDSTIINMLFGHGPKSYGLIGTKFNYYGGSFHITSNNLFTDIFWEHGIVGLVGLFLLFMFFLKNSISLTKLNNKIEWIIFMLTVHLIASGFYRADFASGRFFVVCTILILLIQESKFNISNNPHTQLDKVENKLLKTIV